MGWQRAKFQSQWAILWGRYAPNRCNFRNSWIVSIAVGDSLGALRRAKCFVVPVNIPVSIAVGDSLGALLHRHDGRVGEVMVSIAVGDSLGALPKWNP